MRKPGEINSAGNRLAGSIASIPDYLMISGLETTINKVADFSSRDVINRKGSLAAIDQREIEDRVGVEGIRIIAFQFSSDRNRGPGIATEIYQSAVGVGG